ncbi:uncharacterized protein LOC105387240 [Plutella xylostella]|uniref:uncharacterized protein LOC105387240 n=1 Tax=Plutella xylostella TaxID=51655 RepID=UPI00203224F5|nr:uncharacterized protein LOC105387240 [Plutella xylostella]
MKVKYAAQILSNTVAAVLKLLSEADLNPQHKHELMETALVIQDLYKLFDYTNGPSGPQDIKKGIRQNVSAKTDHLNVWADFRKKMEKLVFVKSNGMAATNVRCVKGYLITLSSLQDLWNKLSRLGFKYLNLRQLNQDALENLFGIIRQHSPTNKNPTCASFIGAIKTALISGLTAPHNRGSNCEEDCKKLLTNFHELVFENESMPKKDDDHDDHSAREEKEMEICEDSQLSAPVLSLPEVLDFEDIEKDLTDVDSQPLVYLSGYIASIIIKQYNCLRCKNNLTAEEPESCPLFRYIKLREWWNAKSCLTYPSLNLCRTIEIAITVFNTEIIGCLHQKNICQLAVTLFFIKCDISWFSCEMHSKLVFDVMFVRLSRLLVRRQCQRVNLSLSEKEENLASAVKNAQQRGISK